MMPYSSSFYLYSSKENIVVKHWYHNENEEKLIDDSLPIPNGFIKGRSCSSKDSLKSHCKNSINRKWYTNGEIEIYLTCEESVPDGFYEGRLKFIWINNGVQESKIKLDSSLPLGWEYGMLEKHKNCLVPYASHAGVDHPMYGKHHSEETRLKISLAEKGSNHWAWGTKQSEATKSKRSNSLKNHKVSNITKQKISIANSDPSHETRQKMSISAINRIINKGYSCKGKQGWYKGYHCMSTWELAYVIYNIEHNIKFIQNKEWFTYTYKNSIHRYLPDFKEGDYYIEIKGFIDDRYDSKVSQFPYKLKIIDTSSISMYLDYAVEKYGKDFWYLYE